MVLLLGSYPVPTEMRSSLQLKVGYLWLDMIHPKQIESLPLPSLSLRYDLPCHAFEHTAIAFDTSNGLRSLQWCMVDLDTL